MRALLDGDILLYSVGHAIDERYYTVQQERFTYKADAVQYCEDTCITTDQSKFHREAAPLPFYLHGLKQKISSILQATECDEYTLYLTGDNNFRKEIAVTHEYKGNRDENGKPLKYLEMKEYLINNFNTVVAEDCEADDYLSINHTEDTILCSTDKDLDQSRGFHYSWDDNELYYVSQQYADWFLYRQILTGDWSTDRIIGCGKLQETKSGKLARKGIGPKEAERLLKYCTTTEEMLKVVGLQYAIQFDDPEDMLREQTSLVYICRTEDDILAPGQTPLRSMYE